MMLLGAALVVGGLFLLPLPGPGALVVVFGLVLLSWVSPPVTTFLDRREVRLRAVGRRALEWWARAPIPVRILVGAVLAVL
jgi:hypothetical protein